MQLAATVHEGGEFFRAEGVQPIVEGDGERGVDKTSSNTVANKGGEPSRAEGVAACCLSKDGNVTIGDERLDMQLAR